MNLRRHRNRALYNVDTKRWVPLRDVARALRAGDELSVTEVGTERDCTALVLAQLIYEEALRGADLPKNLLLDALRAAQGAQKRPRGSLSDAVIAADRARRRSSS